MQAWGGQRLRMYGVSYVSIVDVRSASAFSEGHVPFALNVPGDVFRRHVATPEELAGVLGRAGVNPSQEAVVVSGGGLTKDSALAFVMLERLGQHRVSVLMDASDAWARLGWSLTTDAKVVGPRTPQQPLAISPVTYAATVRTDLVITDPNRTQGVFPKVFVASGDTVPPRAQDGKVVHVPCVATLGAIKQEFGTSWAWTSAIYQTIVAWIAASLVYQGGRLLGLG